MGAVADATLQLALSQAATIPGTAQLTASSVSCYTTSDGSVVGLPDPLATPAISTSTSSGSLQAGTYYIELAYQQGSSRTLPSPEAVAVLGATGQVSVAAPSGPAAVAAYAVYIGTSPGAETLQGTAAAGSPYVQPVPLVAGSALPASNATTCAVAANDSLIPTGTYYTATLTDIGGNTVGGYPASWYISGAALDVSRIIPLATNPASGFPLPVLQNPTQTTAQSITTDLDLNGHLVADAGNVGPAIYSGYAATEPSLGTAIYAFQPSHPLTLVRLDLAAATVGSGGTAGLTVTATQGASTCTFGGLLIAATGYSDAPGTGSCNIAANAWVLVAVSADDHITKPQELNFALEAHAQ